MKASFNIFHLHQNLLIFGDRFWTILDPATTSNDRLLKQHQSASIQPMINCDKRVNLDTGYCKF